MTRDAIGLHDDYAADWENRYRSRSFRQRLDVFSELIERSGLEQGRWLDAGCGTGTLCRLLAEQGAQVHGVDGSAPMLDQAQALSQGLSGVTFGEPVDLDQWEWPGDPFDGVVCSSVIEYLRDPPCLLAALHRAIRPGGVLCISVPNAHSILRRVQHVQFAVSGRLGRSPSPAFLVHSKNHYAPAAAVALLRQAGFEPELQRFFGCPKRLPFDSTRYVAPLLGILARRVP